MSGFSESNLKYCKRFYLFYSQDIVIRPQLVDELEKSNFHQLGGDLQQADNKQSIIRQQLVDELETHPLFQIPWGHHVQIITKCKSVHEALFYVQKTIKNGWSRAVLMNFMEADLYSAQGKALNNFSKLLPEPQSDLANEILKDPYNFDFLTLTEPYKEKELEDALTTNITKFLLELGQGFAYVGRQVPVKIGKKERFIDLLFYHLELRCYVVIELKAGEFEAEHTGKLGLYISAINHQRKKDADNPTIGLLICKTKDNIEVEYSLESSSQPIGISEYQLSKILPDNYKSALPSIEEIEAGLKNGN
jgi:predicted nuclease of restriction endonuclease-like (RecB) superfamily